MDMDRKPAYLRALKIKSVSVVDQGANQHAHIRIAKRAEDEDELEKQVENTDTAFFARLGRAVAKLFHVSSDSASTYEAAEKRHRQDDTIYTICDALGESLRSIARDDSLSDVEKVCLITDTADQVAKAVKDDFAQLFEEETEKAEPTPPKKDDDDDDEPDDIDTDDDEPDDDDDDDKDERTQKGVCEMNFDMDKMTPDERQQLEELHKRYGVEENKKDEPKDIYKGVDPAVLAEIEELRKFKQNIEEKQVLEVAKKYEILGKKSDELAGVLKSLKAVGGTAYDDMVSMLDSAVQAVEQSKVFSEIGKRGDVGTENPWAKIEAAAAEVCKSNKGMSLADAIDKVCIEHPELVQAYEESRR